MYNLIEQERDKAVAKIEAKQAKLQKQEGKHGQNNTNGSVGGITTTSSFGGGGGEGGSLTSGGGVGFEQPSVEEDSSSGGSNLGFTPGSPEAQALALANAAIDSVTKADVSEIRSFRHPPPAVTMVTSAVMILCQGRALPWDEAKKAMANGESFIASLLNVQPDAITPRQLKALMPYVKSPVFRPEAVAPVCLCAAKFCAWVLGTLEVKRKKPPVWVLFGALV